MARCSVCADAAAVTGFLCEECAASIHGAAQLYPEQVVASVDRAAGAVVIDRWGRAHPIATRTLIGRQLERNSIAIAEASVSRRHAELLRKPDGTWWLLDLVSSNGTTVDDQPVNAAMRLVSRSVLFVGEVGLFFVEPAPTEMPAPVRLPQTHRPPESPEAPTTVTIGRLYAEEDKEDGLDEVSTFMGLREVELVLASPTGGGGGFATIGARGAQLTMTQFELVRVLAQRMYDERQLDERVRGFVRSSELLSILPWDTARPEDNHIKQLVRRVRRVFVRAEIGDLIESRHGFGYRLRVRLSKNPFGA